MDKFSLVEHGFGEPIEIVNDRLEPFVEVSRNLCEKHKRNVAFAICKTMSAMEESLAFDEALPEDAYNKTAKALITEDMMAEAIALQLPEISDCVHDRDYPLPPYVTSVVFLDRDGPYVNKDSLRDGVFKATPKSSIGMEDDMRQHCERSIFVLNEILKETTCHVVYSSCHRKNFSSLEDLQTFFNESGIKAQAVGMTGHSHPGPGGRASEIQEWLDSNPQVTRFLVIDDDNVDYLNPANVKPPIRGWDDDNQGLFAKHVFSAIEIFHGPDKADNWLKWWGHEMEKMESAGRQLLAKKKAEGKGERLLFRNGIYVHADEPGEIQFVTEDRPPRRHAMDVRPREHGLDMDDDGFCDPYGDMLDPEYEEED